MLGIDEIMTVAVIGAGVMGSGIAQTFAQAGYTVRLHARREASLKVARERIAKNQAAMVRAGLGFYDYLPGGSEAVIAARDTRLFEFLKVSQ